MRTDQKVRGEEDCGRGIRLGSWRKVTGQLWGLLILKRIGFSGESLCSHALDFRALSKPRKGAGKSNQRTCGIASATWSKEAKQAGQ